ncbi:MAG: hypothetical protein QOJ66_2570, partial [Ilumatobacteraceae bacterium]
PAGSRPLDCCSVYLGPLEAGVSQRTPNCLDDEVHACSARQSSRLLRDVETDNGNVAQFHPLRPLTDV